VNGMNVYPRMIEEVVHALAGVREVAVIGEPNGLHGEVPVAYVACDPESAIDENSSGNTAEPILGDIKSPSALYL